MYISFSKYIFWIANSSELCYNANYGQRPKSAVLLNLFAALYHRGGYLHIQEKNFSEVLYYEVRFDLYVGVLFNESLFPPSCDAILVV